MSSSPLESTTGIKVRTFLIGDVRGYTNFTRQRGDAAAARLAKKFADLARDAVEARGGRVIELRGDEALAVFESTAQAVRAAVELQASCREETAADPELPLPVGIGIDAGEAVPVEEGFRGAALNRAARLCSKATAGQVLVTRAVADLASDVDVVLEGRGSVELKGFDEPVELVEAVWADQDPPISAWEPADLVAEPLPPALDALTPLVAREHEMHWLRGTWRQARRGNGRVVIVSGAEGLGKTRLVAELAGELSRGSGVLRYAGSGGTALADARALIREASEATQPGLYVLDDLNVTGDGVVTSLAEALDAIGARPAFVVGLVREPEAMPALASLLERADRCADGHLVMTPVDADAVRDIARLYVGDEVADLPVESMLRASGGVPARVHEVVSGWAHAEASRRLEAAAEWLAEGRDRHRADLDFANNVIGLKLGRLYAPTVAPGEGDDVCPFKGLASFEESDAGSFFGRERLVGELAARTVQAGLVGVLGASGSGKSSIIFAGLLPSLRAGLLPGSERWQTTSMRPGEHPIAELRAVLPDEGSTHNRVVLVVDQFEEVFTTCSDEPERAEFIQALAAVASSPERAVVVVVMRGDFYDRCAPYSTLAHMITANHVLVGAMTREELRRAIELPARRAGLRVDSALTEELVREVADETGGLPLLSTALVELWQTRQNGWLRMDAYERTGGVRGAVARLAEAAYEHLSEHERALARGIFLRLTGPGEGEAATRRRVPLSEFDLGRDQVAAAVLDRLTADRLLTRHKSSIEVAHEALLREWPRLREWLDDDARGRQIRQHLTQSAKQWDASGRDDGELYRGARLAAALEWGGDHDRELNELERQFLTAGRHLREADQRLEEERRQKELEDARRVASAQRRSARLLRGLAVVLILGLVASSIATLTARHQSRIAKSRQLAAASTSELQVDPEISVLLAEEATKSARTPQAETALRSALRDNHATTTMRGHQNPIADAIFSPDGKRVLTRSRPLALGAASSSGPTDLTIRMWDTATGRAIWTAKGDAAESFEDAVFAGNGSTVITVGSNGAIRTWSADAGTQLSVWRIGVKPLKDPFERVWRFSPDGRLLAEEEGGAATDGSPRGLAATDRVWDTTTHKLIRTINDLKTENAGRDFVFLGGRLAATVGDAAHVVIWNLGTGRVARVLAGAAKATFFDSSSTRLFRLAASPDGRRIGLNDDIGDATIWDVRTGKRLEAVIAVDGDSITLSSPRFSDDGQALAINTGNYARIIRPEIEPIVLRGHTARVTSVAFSHDGNLLATTSRDHTVRIWDANNGALLTVLRGHTAAVVDAVFNADGSRIASSSDDATARVWDPVTGVHVAIMMGCNDLPPACGPPRTLQRDGGFGWGSAFSDDGRFLATSGALGARTWSVKDFKQVALFPDMRIGDFDQADTVTFNPAGTLLVFATTDARLEIWSASSAQRLHDIAVPVEGGAFRTTPVWKVAFSRDGRRFVTSSQDGGVRLWNPQTGALIKTFKQEVGVNDAAFSPDDHEVATAADDGIVRVWNVSTGKVARQLRGHQGGVNGLDWSRDGAIVATASEDGTVRTWNAASGRSLLILQGATGDAMTDVAISSNGRWLVATSRGGTVEVRDAETGDSVETLRGFNGSYTNVAFAPNGSLIAAGGFAGASEVFRCVLCAPLDSLLQLARTRTTRTMTADERRQFSL